MNIKKEFNDLTQNSDKKLVKSILFLTIILFVYCYFGSFSFFETTFASCANLNYWKIIYHNCMAFVLFFVFGIIYTKLVCKSSLKDMGIKKGNYKLGLIICLIATFVVVPIAMLTVLDRSMASTYPLVSFNEFGEWYYILGYFASYILYYIGWEYLFRGLGLFSLEESTGAFGAIVITTMISALIHTSIAGFGKPMVETLSAIPAGLIFGYITYKTKSIWYSFYIHMLIGILTDVFITILI